MYCFIIGGCQYTGMYIEQKHMLELECFEIEIGQQKNVVKKGDT